MGLVGVDTGNPFVLLNPMNFPEAPAVGSVSSVTVGSDTLQNVPVVTSDISPVGPDPSVPLGGLLGCAFICSSVVSRSITVPLSSRSALPLHRRG